MGELCIEKALHCLICDSEVQLNESYSIFYTFITNSGILLANSLEKNLSLKNIGSLSLRSNLLCIKCFGYFEQLTNCESKIIKLKGELWTIYKGTCEKHGEKAETHVKGVSTQTDFSTQTVECECKTKKNVSLFNFKVENNEEQKQENDLDSNKGFEDSLEVHASDIKAESERSGEEITVDADPHFTDEDSSKWRKKPESCKLCGKWFKKVSELDNHMICHIEMDKERSEKGVFDVKVKRKFHSCTICNKKFRRPCEVKEHMVSHKSATPFICKYCGKKLKSKTGAIYHTLKTHKIDIGNSKKLDEHFHIDVKNKDVLNDNYDTNVEAEYDHVKKGGKVSGQKESSSSEDELPLARRRKEFMFEKIKKEFNTEKLETLVKKQKNIQKQALQALQKWCDVSVTKVSKNLDEEGKNKILPLNRIKQEEEILSVVGRIDSEEVRSKISDLSKTNEVTIQTKSDQSSDSGRHLANQVSATTNEKTKSRTKKYSMNNVIKMKGQKDTYFIPPPIKEPKFKCDVCEKMWKTRGELNAHKITHSDARPYICEICGQAYKHKPALDVHVGMHRGIYHHQCPYCQKAFTQKGALQRHLPIHTGDLPYQCELCGKRFVHHTSFSMHSLTHSGIRKVKCQICGMGLLSKSHLRRHTRVHTGEKPFSCNICGKPFAERYNLVAHQRIHDPNLVGPARHQKKKLQTCRLCNATFDRRHKLEDHMVTIHNKVVEDAPHSSIFESQKCEGFTSSRISVDRFDSRKQTEKDRQNEKLDLAVSSNANDLSLRTLQGLQNTQLKNLELIRNLENSRNFELLRMANGINSVEENLRLSGTGSGTPWTYVNPDS